MQALGTPVEIQDAVDRDELTLAQAGQVGYLRREQQDSIAAAIRAGAAPADSVADFVEAKRTSGSANAAFRSFVVAARVALKQLRNRSRDVSPHLAHEHLTTLEQIAKMLPALMQRGSPEELARADESLSKLLDEIAPDVD